MKIKVEIITPVFIGSGEEYYPYDYILFEDRLCFIDRKKMIERLIDAGKYEAFLSVSEDIDKLLEFIDAFTDKSDYLECIETENEANEKLFTTLSLPLKAFIKDRYFFKPYIPGSSLKGAIRTALLDYKIHQFWCDDFEQLNDKQLETIIFCNENKNEKGYLQYDAKKDILKVLYIEDLKPLNYRLKAIKPKNRPYTKNKDNTIPLVLEAIIDGVFEGEIRIEENLLKNDEDLKNNKFFQDDPLSFALIQKAINKFYKKIYNIENKRFRARFSEYEPGMIKIGKHSGAGSKSLNDLRKIWIPQKRQNVDYQFSVWIDSNESPLGWIKIDLL